MIRLGILPDIHMRHGEASRIREELELVIDQLGRDGTDHVFVLGDLIEDAGSAADDEVNVERVRGAFDGAPFGVTYLLGNHDVENLSRDRLSALLGQDRFTGEVAFDGGSVIYLDSSSGRTAGARGELGSEQRAWLADVLEEHAAPLVLCHHPLGTFDLADNEWFRDYPERAFCGDRKETLDLLEAHGSVRGTISGHLHQTGLTTFRGMPHVSVNAFSKELPEKPLSGTYATVGLNDGVTVDVAVRNDVRASYTL